MQPPHLEGHRGLAGGHPLQGLQLTQRLGGGEGLQGPNIGNRISAGAASRSISACVCVCEMFGKAVQDALKNRRRTERGGREVENTSPS